MGSYARPQDMSEALALLTEGPRRVLAGGTDLYPGAGASLTGDVLDLTGLVSLRGITFGPNGVRIGACTTWSEIADADLPPALAALQQAARQVGGRQIQNAGTLGGNLCNASPAADGVPPLLTLDAVVKLVSSTGQRSMALSDFLIGPRRTALRADEVLAAVVIPKGALEGRSAFLKLGARAYLVISIAMVAVRVHVEDGRIVDIAIAVGACGPVARRLQAVEAALLGASLAAAPTLVKGEDVAAALSPIDDVRASADYRIAAATELVARALFEVAT